MLKLNSGVIAQRGHVIKSWFTIFAQAIAALTALTMPASAQPPPATIDLQLVLAVDTSGSVNQQRFELQRAGYAAAFRDTQVLNAVRGGRTGSIAVTMFQWTGYTMQVVVVPWMLIKDTASAEAVARAIERAPRQLFGGGTSISGAIDFSVTQFPLSPWPASRRVIDVSGDGANNRGRPAAESRDVAVARGITINGLPILALEHNLDTYYRDNVIGGPGAFMIATETFEAFADAVRRKLVLEISGHTPKTNVAGQITRPVQ